MFVYSWHTCSVHSLPLLRTAIHDCNLIIAVFIQKDTCINTLNGFLIKEMSSLPVNAGQICLSHQMYSRCEISATEKEIK